MAGTERTEMNPSEAVYPLTASECGMYLEQQNDPESTEYNLNLFFHIRGAEKEALDRAVRESLASHEAFRSRYGNVGGEPVRILEESPPELVWGEAEDPEEAKRDILSRDLPYDLAASVPVRPKALELRSGGILLYIGIHHISYDGGSTRVFAQELFDRLKGEKALYTGPDLSECRSGYGDEALEKGLSYFREVFKDGLPANELPVKGKRPRLMPQSDRERVVPFDGGLLTKVEKAAKDAGVSTFQFLFSAVSIVTGKYCGSRDLVLGVPVDTRDEDSRITIGMFVNSAPVRVRPSAGRKIADFLKEVKESVHSATREYRLPFSEVVKEFDPGHDPSRNPVFDVSVNYLYEPPVLSEGGLSIETWVPLQHMKRDLAFTIRRTKTDFRLTLQYSSLLFDNGLIDGLVEQFVSTINVMCDHPECTVGEAAALPVRQEALLEKLSLTAGGDIPEPLLHRMFEGTARKYPRRTAVIASDRSLTFKELNDEADRVCSGLIAMGVKPRDRVILLLKRRSFYFSALLGVLKAGASFIPCDPAYPEERISRILEDSDASLVITSREQAKGAFSGKEVLIETLSSHETAEHPEAFVTGDDPAYLIYTSGSTGTPKGVVLSHRGISNYYSHHPANILYFLVKKEIGVMLSVTTVSFDMSLKDTLGIMVNGKTVIFASEDEMNDPRALVRLLQEKGGDAMSATPSRYQQYLKYGPFAKALQSLKLVAAGGEPFPEGLLSELKELKVPHIINSYGPTEITVSSNMASLEDADHISIGRPILNVREYIVDREGNLTPPGATGELLIGGPGVAIGYRNLEEQNRQSFISFRGERFYRSGDYARFDRDGNVLILGRMDGQVKLRGLRIELGEVENALSGQNGVEQAAAAVKTFNGTEHLVAWYSGDSAPEEAVLRKALSARLPGYMVPDLLIRVPGIPVNANGKTDRNALSVPEGALSSGEMKQPETEAEKKLFEIVSDIMETDAFGTDTGFEAIGLTSLTMVTLMLRAGDAFGRDVTMAMLRSHDSIRELAAALEQSEDKREWEILKEYPLTGTQLGIYTECLKYPDTTVYNIPVLWKLGDGVDTERLKGAVERAVDAHPFLKARLSEGEEGIVALRDDSLKAETEVIRMDHAPAPEELMRPFDLLKDPLLRTRICITPEGNYFYLDMHHIASDGKSRAILQRDIEKAYAGETPVPERFTGFEEALREAEERKGEGFDRAKAWFDGLLSDVSPTELSPVPGDPGEKSEILLETGLDSLSVREFCHSLRITGNDFFNAVFGYTLGIFGASDEAVFTTIYDGRDDTRLRDTVTMLVRTLPVRTFWNGEDSIGHFLLSVRDQLNSSMENSIYSFGEIAAAYGVTSDYMLAFQDEDEVPSVFCGEEAVVFRPVSDTAKSDLSVDVSMKGGRVVFSGEHRSETFGEGFTLEFLRCMEQVSSEFMKKSRLSEVCSVSEDTEERLKALYDTDYPVEERPAYRLLKDSALKWPDRTAVVTSEEKLTYGELYERAGRLALMLMERGLGVEKLCAVILGRSARVYTARQGILRAGGAFLPIDPEYPDERISFILKDADCRVVVTSRELYGSRTGLFSQPGLEVVFVEDAENSELPSDPPEVRVPFDALAYSIYTSGSTGQPKGVLLTQRNLVSFVDDNPKNREILGYTERGHVSLALASIAFDVSVMEEFIPLAHGLTVCMASEEERHDHGALNRLCVENGVDIITTTPSSLANFLDDPDMHPAIRALKSLDVGAEAFPAALYGRIRELNPDVYIMNGYGPTEATISCTMAVMEGDPRVTVGQPGSNVKVAVTDRFGHPVPQGALGEMVIIGECVGRGYRNRDDLTQKNFIRFWDRPAYRSGDLARILPGGDIEFSGRTDNQVKLRGFRVELDEIENVILGYPGIRLCCVVVRNKGGEDYLAGFFTAENEIDIEKLKDHLRSKLTPYMVPDVFMQLPRMPLTVNEKIDRKKLPEVEYRAEEREYAEPENDIERRLCGRIAEILRLDRVGATDDFFSIGGTSLSAALLVSFAMKQGYDVVYRNIFEYPTVRALADFIKSRMEAGSASGPEGDGGIPAETKAEASDEECAPALRHNVPEELSHMSSVPPRSVLLTGATGFLGIHVLAELLGNPETEHIYCLLRGKSDEACLERLLSLFIYYGFQAEDGLDPRIRAVRGDVTDEDLAEKLKDIDIDRIINCAAVVKHFEEGNMIRHVNYDGLLNLIEVALAKDASLTQVSTLSVSGTVEAGRDSASSVKLYENTCDLGQRPGTKYSASKLDGEKALLRAVSERGLKGRIVRVGNLMGREMDGEFQINFRTNGFITRLKAYKTIGCFPVDGMDEPVDFSPVDCTARALVLLSGTPDRFTVYHADNCHYVHMANVIEGMADCGYPIEVVPASEFERRLEEALEDENKSVTVSSILSYRGNAGEKRIPVPTDSSFTVKALYRLGFSWPVTGRQYIERMLGLLKELLFFD